ncbi:hypothetical protein CSA37_07000 [Candidatus Fermentibacteria bacterium]|nr:MAG: hypothetical protein CSA37_09895 [Candidatus Fermentibacteria bacterium]PIE52307.1 MAG: hypothetical protein CSA37_07000 [Candidatus Fermentibacteria bacterium]
MIFLAAAMLMANMPGAVVLSEVMYNPDGKTLGLDEHMEWIELYNSSAEAVNLAGMMLSDGNNQLYLGHYLLAPDTYGVVCANQSSFEAAYGTEIRVIPWSGEWTRLRNSSDEIIVYSEDGTVLETLRYDENWGADGTTPSPADGGGASLERIDPSGPNDDTNWKPSEDYANPTADDGGNAVCWGTPGEANTAGN